MVKTSATIKSLIKEVGIDKPIMLPDFTTATLTRVLEYLKHHWLEKASALTEVAPDDNKSAAPKTEKDTILVWDKEFCDAMDQATFIETFNAPNYLDISEMREMMARVVAKSFDGLTPDQIRVRWGIPAELGPEDLEEAKIILGV